MIYSDDGVELSREDLSKLGFKSGNIVELANKKSNEKKNILSINHLYVDANVVSTSALIVTHQVAKQKYVLHLHLLGFGSHPY